MRACRFSAATFTIALLAAAAAGQSERVRVRIDAEQAEAVLALLEAGAAGREPGAVEWERVLASAGYRRLKDREAAMQRAFTDEEFRAFVAGGEAAGRGAELRRTLEAWRRADLEALAARALAYLPARARIVATVYPVIKPRPNSFVWELDRDPAIFLYLDPEVTAEQFANTVAHELHHVGLHSIAGETAALTAALPEGARRAAEWMGAFGEGLAMLAAAGSPDVHPHTVSRAEVRERWDRDSADFAANLATVNAFFDDVIAGRLAGDAVAGKAMEFFGVQGPWYTVGYRMAAAVERRRGRAALLRCMEDPRALLATWNAIAGDDARWSEATLAAVGARPVE